MRFNWRSFKDLPSSILGLGNPAESTKAQRFLKSCVSMLDPTKGDFHMRIPVKDD